MCVDEIKLFSLCNQGCLMRKAVNLIKDSATAFDGSTGRGVILKTLDIRIGRLIREEGRFDGSDGYFFRLISKDKSWFTDGRLLLGEDKEDLYPLPDKLASETKTGDTKSAVFHRRKVPTKG